MNLLSKKPKVETSDTENEKDSSVDEQEEALVALIEHRTKEVDHVTVKLTYYKSQLEGAQKRLLDSQSQLARLRSQHNASGSKKTMSSGVGNVKTEPKSASPLHIDEGDSRTQGHSRPQLVIPAVNPKIGQPIRPGEANVKMTVGPKSRPITSGSAQSDNVGRLKGDPSCRPSEQENIELQNNGRKRKFGKVSTVNFFPGVVFSKQLAYYGFWFPGIVSERSAEQKEHVDLISCIRSSSSPCIVRFQPGTHISSQHKRKLRSLALSPTSDQLFVTSALDGVVNLWQIQAKGSTASLLSTTDCVSPKQRRWPEDLTWHPYGDSLFAVYSADGGDSQISILNLNSAKEKRVVFLEEKPHLKGIINNISFMPWIDLCFATGGSDHAVIFWNEKDGENKWKPKPLHRNLHSSAVMGVAGMHQKKVTMSVGADKRIIGFDIQAARAEFKHQIESKCMGVLPNPSDFNLFMVQTGTPEKQLRLFDIRLRNTELHAFGWKQESSESQSALINQAWSPDGLYITSGSADPKIHIFDIRYNSRNPSQSVKAHQKRVFKAVWHHSLPILISISSDLHIGLHRIM